MSLKSKLVPFFAAGVLISSVAARAQTASNPDTGSSATGQMPGTYSGAPAGDPNAPGAAAPAPASPDPSSSNPSTPGASTDATATSPAANSPGNTGSSSTDSSGTSVSPDSSTTSK